MTIVVEYPPNALPSWEKNHWKQEENPRKTHRKHMDSLGQELTKTLSVWRFNGWNKAISPANFDAITI